jgi:hypothetical protein
MVDSLMCIVLLGSNRNRVGSTSGGRCSSSSLIGTGAWIGASVGVMSLVSIAVAPTICLHWVLGSLGPLNTLISSSRSLEIFGGTESLDATGWKILVQLLAVLAETAAEQDRTQVRLRT